MSLSIYSSAALKYKFEVLLYLSIFFLFHFNR